MSGPRRLPIFGASSSRSPREPAPRRRSWWRGWLVGLAVTCALLAVGIGKVRARERPARWKVHTTLAAVPPADPRPAEVSPSAGLPDDTEQVLVEGGFFDPEAFDDAQVVRRKAYVHLMPGIPNEVFFGGAAAILLLSFVAFERRGPAESGRTEGAFRYPTWELTRWRPLAAAMKRRWFQPVFQAPVVLVFVGVIVAGLVGNQAPGRNIAPVVTWNVWWIGLIFAVFGLGNAWCFACPWTAIPDWCMRLSPTSTKAIVGLDRRYPKLKLWLWPATALLVFVTWLEIAYDAANRPWLTSVLAIGMVVLAWASLLVFERKAMCRYLCFVGRVSGQYALLGMLELRRRDHEVCRTCRTKDCYHGREGVGLPCPTHEYMGAMDDNQYCTLCTECVKSCPHDNIALRLRPPGADIAHAYRARRDEAMLAIVILVISAFHGLAMTPMWSGWEQALRERLISAEVGLAGADVVALGGSSGGIWVFTAMMAACIVLPTLAFAGLCRLMRMASGRTAVRTATLFTKLAYTLLPIALCYHLAHNATHVFYEWSKLRRLASDPLGWGHDFFGTARAPLSALWTPESIWGLQVVLVLAGHIASIVVARREVRRLYRDLRASRRAHTVMTLGMVLLSMLSLWLLAQPMFMRTAQ